MVVAATMRAPHPRYTGFPPAVHDSLGPLSLAQVPQWALHCDDWKPGRAEGQSGPCQEGFR